MPGDIERAAEAAEADDLIQRLPEGYATMLGKWFLDGSELSVGEWQRGGAGAQLLPADAASGSR